MSHPAFLLVKVVGCQPLKLSGIFSILDISRPNGPGTGKSAEHS